MEVVWGLRSRQLATSLGYWLTLVVGYDRSDRSLSHKIYLLYAALFFTGWGFAMLSLLGGVTLSGLKMLQPRLLFGGGPGPAFLAAAFLALLLLLAWALLQAWSAARRSPLVFSEDDAHLVCQTPLSRRAVAFAWWVGDWGLNALGLGAAWVVLAFAAVEGSLAQVSVSDIPLYVASGARALLAAALLVGGLLALVWAFGCLRLQPGGRLALSTGRLKLIPPALGVFLLLGLVLGSADLHPFFFQLLAPLSAWIFGAFVPNAAVPNDPGLLQTFAWSLLGSLAWLLAGGAALWFASPGISLSQAAQETAFAASLQAAAAAGNFQVVGKLQLEQHLGAAGAPRPTWLARRQPGPGWQTLLWRQALQLERRGAASFFSGWGLIFLAALGASLAPDWGSRGWALLVWGVLVCQRAAGFTRADLAQWALLRGLPVPAGQILLAGAALPAILAGGLGGLALLGGLAGGGGIPAYTFLFLPALALALALAGAVDVLRPARSHHLLAGQVPSAGGLSLLIAAGLLAALIFGMAWLLEKGTPLPLAVLAGLAISFSAAWVLYEIGTGMLKDME